MVDRTLELGAGDYRLVLAPERGGSILRFDWRGLPVMRPVCGPSILDVACFPLVPFSNRIAHGRFSAEGREVRLSPNFPGGDHPHPLHGFGWLAPWRVISADAANAVLQHDYEAGEWPWAYTAREVFALQPDGLRITLALRNRDTSPMPAGLGFHPYFPRTPAAVYHGLHRGEWQNDAECLPLALDEDAEVCDWWNGGAVSARVVDTVYTGREGDITLSWPEREMTVTLAPSPDLSCTVVYTPIDAPFFCIEPVSHATDAVNRSDEGMRLLAPGDEFVVVLAISTRI